VCCFTAGHDVWSGGEGELGLEILMGAFLERFETGWIPRLRSDHGASASCAQSSEFREQEGGGRSG